MTEPANNSDAAAMYFAALSSRSAGILEEAEIFCRKSIELNPQKLSSKVVLGEILLAQGKYIEGFKYFDVWPELQQALGLGEIPQMPFPRWQGEPLGGKSLLVLPLQGYGDQIQYARFIGDLVRLGIDVTVIVPPPLEDLFKVLGAIIVPSVAGIRIPRHDYWTYPISLPRWLGSTPENISGRPYLGERATSGTKIGIAWSGNPAHPNDRNRTASREAFLPILENFDVVELGVEQSGVTTFAETASILDQCRAIVSVDTSVVHLAGALGFPCHLVLPATDPDWRWMSGPKTHWYDSVTIYRQREAGDWAVPIRQVVNSLRE